MDKYYVGRFGDENWDYFRVEESELNDKEKRTNRLSEERVFKKTFSGMVMSNEIFKLLPRYETLTDYDDEEVYQYFIVDSYYDEEALIKIVQKTRNHLYYSRELDNYILGVTDLGTHRSYVMTDIELEEEKY